MLGGKVQSKSLSWDFLTSDAGFFYSTGMLICVTNCSGSLVMP